MSDETKSKPDDTSADDGKKTDPASDEGKKDTQPPKTEDAKKTITQEEHQAELNRIAVKTRKEEKEKYEREKADAEKKRKEEELKEQGKLQELADTREKERDTAIGERNEAVREKTEVQTRYDALAKRVSESVTAEIALLPEHLRDLAPAETDLDARLEWLPKAKQAATKEAEREPKPGNPRNPKATNPPGTADAEKAARVGQSRLYNDL